MKDAHGGLSQTDDVADLYKAAKQIERESWQLFKSKAAEASDPKLRSLLEKIATEEEKRYLIISQIVDFLEAAETC
jgi:rubrerythrin